MRLGGLKTLCVLQRVLCVLTAAIMHSIAALCVSIVGFNAFNSSIMPLLHVPQLQLQFPFLESSQVGSKRIESSRVTRS
jgi:hypothetical protein